MGLLIKGGIAHTLLSFPMNLSILFMQVRLGPEQISVTTSCPSWWKLGMQRHSSSILS